MMSNTHTYIPSLPPSPISLDSVYMMREVPCPGDKVEGEIIDHRLTAEELATEHIGQHTTVMMQVN